MANELFEKAPVRKAYFKMALPVVLGMVVSLVYNMVDTFFIARTQDTNLVAGVSLCAPVFTMMIALGDIFGLGGSSVISRLFGEGKDEEGKRVSGFCFYGAILCGLAVTVLMLALRQPILQLLGANEDTMKYASQYYFYMALGAPFVIVSFTPSNVLRTEGLAMESMTGTMAGSVLNMILDPIFIFSLGLGAGGAAIATVLGNVGADALLIYYVRKRSKKLTVSWKNIRIDRREIGAIFAIGIPASITNIMQSFGVTLVNRYLVRYGTDKVASMGIAIKVSMLVGLVLVGFAFGAQPLLGYNYGAKNEKRLRDIIRFDLLVETVFSVSAAVVLALAAPGIVGAFMADESIISSGSLMLRCLLMSMPFMGVVLVFTTLFQSMGKALLALILSVSRQGVIFAFCLIILSRLFGYRGVITAQAASDVVTAGIAVGLYLYVGKGGKTGR